MFRYFAILWQPDSLDEQAFATHLAHRIRCHATWRCVYAYEGMAVFCADRTSASDAYPLPGETGVIVGTIFSKRGSVARVPTAKATLDDANAEALVTSKGKELIKSYWGRYVAFIADRRSGTKWIIRDPTGDLPCCHATHHGVSLVFSNVGDCIAFVPLHLSVDTGRLLKRMVYLSRERDSAIREIDTLDPGESLEVTPRGASTALYWDPFEIAESEQIDDLDAAAATLRHVTKACVHAWASCYPAVVVELSGGLDSSIVATCLRDAPLRPQMTAVNFRTRDRNSDERQYARLAAQRAACELVELQRNASINLREILDFAPSISPQNVVMQSIEVGPLLRQVALSRCATSIFTGEGGDSVFGRGGIELATIDYFLRKGLRPSTLHFMWDVAPLVQLSVWDLLASALRHRFVSTVDPRKELTSTRMLVRPEVLEEVSGECDLLPKAFRRNDVQPGLLAYALGVVHPHVFYDPLAKPGDPELVTPITSQPIVEHCLRIPTYMHIHRGVDRAVARRAFASDVPPQITGRFWKGGVERHFRQILVENLPFARELLLDGYLVSDGILDRKKLEDVLSVGPNTSIGYTSEVFDHLCTEAWLRNWRVLSQQAAA